LRSRYRRDTDKRGNTDNKESVGRKEGKGGIDEASVRSSDCMRMDVSEAQAGLEKRVGRTLKSALAVRLALLGLVRAEDLANLVHTRVSFAQSLKRERGGGAPRDPG